jgi:hypothetical protein
MVWQPLSNSQSLLKSQGNNKIAFKHTLQNNLESFPSPFYIPNIFYKVGAIFFLENLILFAHKISVSDYL